MKISIVVPVYNTEKYLEKCLKSLVEQTVQEIEIYCINDGSTDDSGKVLKKYAELYSDKIKVLTKKNGGQASARNMVLPYLKGEYIGFVDSDDWVEIDMYEKMYRKAQETQSDIVICDMVDHYKEEVVYHNSSNLKNKFMITPSACNKIFRRDLVKNDKFPENLWYEDFEFTTKQFMKTNRIASIQEGLYHCHCREGSTMNNNNAEKNLDILSVLEHLEEYIEIMGWQKEYEEVIKYLYLDHVAITTINRLEKQKDKNKREVIKIIQNTVKEKFPDICKGETFYKLPLNRRIIAKLNLCGFSAISKFILNVKHITIKKELY